MMAARMFPVICLYIVLSYVCQECSPISHCMVRSKCSSANSVWCENCEEGYYGPHCKMPSNSIYLCIATRAGIFGQLQQFKEGENWQEYVEMFEKKFIANDKKKLCILCSNVGSSTYHSIKSLCLPDKPETKTFKSICDLVKNHFKPKLSEASASLLFYSRSRKKDEGIQMFLAELRRLVGPCNFGQFVTRALRDRFISGINDEKIQEKILTVPDGELTLDRAFQIAESHEAACMNVREMQKSAGGIQSDGNTAPMLCELEVQGEIVEFQIDTGSPYTIVANEMVRRVFGHCKLDRSKVKIRSLTGHPVLVLGTMDVNVKFRNSLVEARILVTEHKHNLLGRDLIDKLGVLTVNIVREVDTDKVNAILNRHSQLFHNELGKLEGVQAKIHVDGDKTAIFFKPRPLLYAMRGKVEEELQRLEQDQVIEPVKYSDWAAPIVPVLNPNGQVRIFGDYKVTVNKVSKLEEYPIPTLEDLIAKLGKGSVYHKLDLSHAYSQIELEPDSRKFVTINTHKGLFQYKRLPCGVSSAPAQFQRVMESLLQGVPSTVVYFDDILVTGDTEDQSYKNLDQVLDRLKIAGARLKKERCNFGAEEVTFLGHKINMFGIKPIDEKLEALVQAKPPENVHQLKAYLGLLNYYGCFLNNLSEELHPIYKLLRKRVKWSWGLDQQCCFEKTKKMILSAKVLVHYDPNKPLILHTDAAQYRLGAVMSHCMEDGSEHPVGFVSRMMNAAEKNYSQLDKEGAAVIFGLKRFHKYLFGRRFTIVTDHKPLLTLFGEEKQVPLIASPRIQRWAVIMREYEYMMQYRPGKEHMNANADCFSRLSLPVTDVAESEDDVLLVGLDALDENMVMDDCTLPEKIECSPISHCIRSNCSYDNSVVWCENCEDGYYGPHCEATCSWIKRCWPGDCPNKLASSCRCRKGFHEVKTHGVTKCELSALPDFKTCNTRTSTESHTIVRSTPGKNTGCDFESNTYLNFQPKNLAFYLLATFQKKTNISGPFPVYIDETNTGIVRGTATMFVESVTGQQTQLTSIHLHGGTHCKELINDANPSSIMTCQHHWNITQPVNDGERLCTKFEVSSGGYFDYLEHFSKYRKKRVTFTPQTKSKTLCLMYDSTKPKHCSSMQSKGCTSSVMLLDKRITKTDVISIISGDGWFDPVPRNGKARHASGIKSITVEVHEVISLGKVSKVNKASLEHKLKKEISFKNRILNVSFILPKTKKLYSTMLEVHDNAGNVKFARRFVLFDNETEINVDGTKRLLVQSAYNLSNYTWQVNHGLVCLNWTDRYYNAFYIENNILAPIDKDTANEITGVYDQITGKLPVSGTKSVMGLTNFIYSYSLNNGSYTSQKSVPYFQNQSFCLNLTLRDGDTYTFVITAEDIMKNRLSENVTVYIDQTIPEISNTWLVRNKNNMLYIHHSIDLSHMVLEFEAFDPHSGIFTMMWLLGTQNNTSDIGHGALPVITVPLNETCDTDMLCYCPAVGLCAYFNYTLTLNSLIHKNTHIGKHNRHYYFTLKATNWAKLQTVYNLEILVDDSPPVAGVVHEGSPDGPDIDYTSEDYVSINMHGFIDHESDIRFYLVALAERCLTLQEMNNHTQGNTFVIHKTVNPIIKLPFPNNGLFFSSVVAFNNAMEPSLVVCSDGITKDITPPLMTDIRLKDGHVHRGLWCKNTKIWYVNKNMSLVELQQTQRCKNKCSHQENIGYMDVLPHQEGTINDSAISDNLCSKLFILNNESVVYLPSDKIYLTWKTNETESQIRDYLIGIGDDRSQTDVPSLMSYESTQGKEFFHLQHTGLSDRSLFYIFLKIINKASLSSVVILGPVIIDETPPQVTETFYPRISNNAVLVTWTNQSIKDPEELGDQFTVLYRVGFQDQYLTTFMETPENLLQKCQNNGFIGCVQYSLNALQEHNSEQNLPFYFELHIYNTAGHFITVTTETLQLPSKFPPGNGVVFEINPFNPGEIADIDFQNASQDVCVYWKGFFSHSRVTFYVGIGQHPQLDDIVSFVNADKNPVCVNSSVLKPNTKYFTSIKAISSGGTTVSSSDGFIIIDYKNTEYTLNVYDGIGCQREVKPKGHLSLVMKNNKIHGFKIKDLVIGIEHTLFLTTSNLTDVVKTISSHGAIITRNNLSNDHTISFIPVVSDPELFLDHPVTSSTNRHGYVKQCTNDVDFQHSMFQYAMHWQTDGFLDKYVTHFILSIEHNICLNTSTDCVRELTRTSVHASERNYTWNGLSLIRGSFIRANVQSCFEDTCLQRKLSNGLFVVEKPVIINLGAEFSMESSNCTRISLTMDGVCNTNNSRTFQWYLAKEHLGHQRLTPINTIHQRQPLGVVNQNTCIAMSVHSYQQLFICAHVFCTSEFSDTFCKPVMLTEDIRKYKTHMVYDINMKSVSHERVLNLVKSQYLDKESMRFLHKNDINFATSDTLIGGVLTNTANRNVTWYLMTKKFLPRECSADESCLSSLHTVGGVVSFTKIYLQNRQLYYICAHVPASMVNREFSKEKLDSFAGCSNGFIVDDDAPEPGSVAIIRQSNGFITDHTTLYISWFGFTDIEKYVNIPFNSGIAGYSCALGTIPNSEDIVPFRSVGITSTGHLWNITLTNGQIYYATVKATDHLGHTTTVTSEGVVVDTTPPTPGSVSIEGLLLHQHVLPRRTFRILWHGFEDSDSGLSYVRLAVGSLKHNYDIIVMKEYTANYVDIEDVGFIDGHQYQIKFEVINRAGLSTTQHTGEFMIDASPPEIGIVRDGHGTEKDEDYQENTTTYHCHWSGFKDPHSGITSYRVGLGSNPYEADMEPLVSVGLRTNFTWVLPFNLGEKYFVTVEACNQAGLCSVTSSNGLIMDNTPPLGGRVFVGLTEIHQNYMGHGTSLSGHWQGFEDPQTGIAHFEWCLGYEPYKCNLTSFENTQLADSFIKSCLKLPLSVSLYLTVRATNHVGLQSLSTSDGFIVDNTVPTVIEQPHFLSPDFFHRRNISVQTDISVIHAAWKFEDQESPIIKHFLTLKSHHESNVSLEKKEIGAETSHVLTFNKDNRLKNGDVYYLFVTACNQAGLCATAKSYDLLIDSTSAQMGEFKVPLKWENVLRKKRSLTLVNLTWYGFTEPESQISEYQILVSRSYDGFELSGGIEHILPTHNTDEQTVSLVLTDKLRNGELIFLSIRALNSVGLLTKLSKVTVVVISLDHRPHKGYLKIQQHSCDAHYCTKECTCAIVGKICEEIENNYSCKNIQDQTNVNIYPEIKIINHFNAGENVYYTPSTSCIKADWETIPKNYLNNIKRFEWSMGVRHRDTGTGIFTRSERKWHSTGRQQHITYCLPADKQLDLGLEYVVYVRVWYSFTEFKQFESSHVMVDSTAPAIRRGKQVKDSDETCQTDFDFVTRSSFITACWGGVFQDSQSGIDSYSIQIGSTQYGSDVMKPLDVGTKTNYSLSQHLLTAGRNYFVTVKAVNKAGLYKVAFSDGFVIDDEPPVAGVVFNTAEYVNQPVQSSLTSFGVSWRGFHDHHSAVVNYKVAVYKYADVPMKLLHMDMGFKNHIVLSKLSFVQGEWYQASVTAIDSAGLVSTTVMSPPMLVDSTPPIGFECFMFLDITSNITWTSSETLLNLLQTNSLKTRLHVKRNDFFKILVSVTFQPELSKINIFFKVNDSLVPTYFMKMDNSTRMESYHYFLAPKTGSLDIEILSEGVNIISPANVSILSCDKIKKVDGPRALTVKQIMPSLISICAQVFDPESDLLRIKIGVGTTKGGFQIRQLKQTFLHFYEVVEARVPHGTPVYVTVSVENAAGLMSVFMSESLIIDHTPPTISKASATMSYSSGSGSVVVEMKWTVHNKNGVKTCWCSLGHTPYSSNVRPWTLAAEVTRCTLDVTNPYNYEVIYATVKCFSVIDLHSAISVGPRVIMLQPPSSHEGQVMFTINNYNPSSTSALQVQTDTKHFQLSWKNFGEYQFTKTFLYRILDGGVRVTGWMNTSYNYVEVVANLQDGVTYTAEVIAVDERQQQSIAIASSVVVDSRPPSLTGSTIEAHWNEDSVVLNWNKVFHHPRSAMVYNIAVGHSSGYTDLLHEMNTDVTSRLVVLPNFTMSLNVVIKAFADNGEYVIYTECIQRKWIIGVNNHN